MKVELASPVSSISGTCKGMDLVYMTTAHGTFARRNVPPANPRTEDQLRIRSYLVAAARSWRTLTCTQHHEWNEYAKSTFAPGSGRGSRERRCWSCGMTLYVRASVVRQMLGLPCGQEPPVGPPPSRIVRLSQVPGLAADALGIRVEHWINDDVSRYQVCVRATPPTCSPGRKPQPNDLRSVCGIGPASFQPLPASGGEAIFTPVKHPILVGQRYAAEARIIRVEDGIASDSIYAEFRRD